MLSMAWLASGRSTLRASAGVLFSVASGSMNYARAAFKGHSGAKKRFTEIANGSFKFALAGRRHLATGKSRKQIRELGKTAYTNKVQTKTLQQMIRKGMK